MPSITSASLVSTLLLAIPLLFPSTAAGAAVVKKDISSAVLAAGEASLVDAAVTFTVFPTRDECQHNQNGKRYANPDGGCYSLPLQSMDVNAVANTCRIFVYESGSCNGAEKQVYPGQLCVDIASYHSIKVFCG